MNKVNKRKGFVYAFENENRLIKIGTTTNPRAREHQISSMSGYAITKTYCSPECWNPYRIENIVHNTLRDKRKAGEWFNCTLNEAISSIKTIYKMFAVKEYDKAEPDYSGIEEIMKNFFIKPYMPDYCDCEADKINKLEKFTEQEIDNEYFDSCVDMFIELGDYEEADRLKQEYPMLAQGIHDKDEINKFALETYNDLHCSLLCPSL